MTESVWLVVLRQSSRMLDQEGWIETHIVKASSRNNAVNDVKAKVRRQGLRVISVVSVSQLGMEHAVTGLPPKWVRAFDAGEAHKPVRRHIIHPGYVRSRNDGERHFISASQLTRLYGLNWLADHCVNANEPGYVASPNDVHLYPQYDGNYRLPYREARFMGFDPGAPGTDQTVQVIRVQPKVTDNEANLLLDLLETGQAFEARRRLRQRLDRQAPRAGKVDPLVRTRR